MDIILGDYFDESVPAYTFLEPIDRRLCMAPNAEEAKPTQGEEHGTAKTIVHADSRH